MPNENENKKNPLWRKQDIPVMGKVEITFKSSKPLAEGNNAFGPWYLYVIEVADQPVYRGRGDDQQKIDSYSGEAVTFLSEYDKTQLEDNLSDTKNLYESKWEIQKSVTETDEGRLLKKYTFTLLKEGRPYSSSNNRQTSNLSPQEKQLVNDAQELVDEGHLLSKKLFLKASKEPQYGGKISDERAEELYKLLKM